MDKKKPGKLPDVDLGPMPHDLVNDTLGLEIMPGNVVLSGGAQVHAQRNHSNDYDRCLPFVKKIVADPLYLGDDFKLRNSGKIEFVGRSVANKENVLVAISLEIDPRGNYHVHSFYPISEAKVQNRREKGHLRLAQKRNRP